MVPKTSLTFFRKFRSERSGQDDDGEWARVPHFMASGIAISVPARPRLTVAESGRSESAINGPLTPESGRSWGML